jgi:hypothetical protein
MESRLALDRQAWMEEEPQAQAERPATAAGNARSAATIADELSEPPDFPPGRRLAAALWLNDTASMSCLIVNLAPFQIALVENQALATAAAKYLNALVSTQRVCPHCGATIWLPAHIGGTRQRDNNPVCADRQFQNCAFWVIIADKPTIYLNPKITLAGL